MRIINGDNASYDKKTKKFLSEKALLARSLMYLVAELQSSSIKYIERDNNVTINIIPVAPVLTSAIWKSFYTSSPQKMAGSPKRSLP